MAISLKKVSADQWQNTLEIAWLDICNILKKSSGVQCLKKKCASEKSLRDKVWRNTSRGKKFFWKRSISKGRYRERVTLPAKASKRILKFNQACLMSHHYKGVQAPMEINGDFWQTRPYCQVQEIWFVLRCNSICAHTTNKSFNAYDRIAFNSSHIIFLRKIFPRTISSSVNFLGQISFFLHLMVPHFQISIEDGRGGVTKQN